jgi:protein-tyrosine phosphatase
MNGSEGCVEQEMPSVLFVCSANRIRSPMAELLFRQIMQDAPDGQTWRIESAGTWAMEGLPVMPLAAITLAELGLDGRGHRSRCVDGDLLREFDLILTMESGHKEALQTEFPDVAKRVHMISEMIGHRYDIRDPVAGGPVEYRTTALELRRILQRAKDRIAQLAAG